MAELHEPVITFSREFSARSTLESVVMIIRIFRSFVSKPVLTSAQHFILQCCCGKPNSALHQSVNQCVLSQPLHLLVNTKSRSEAVTSIAAENVTYRRLFEVASI
jgi:hypothetical protein